MPLTGFKLYSVDSSSVTVLEFDGSGQPAVLMYTVTGLKLNEDYSYFITALNPLEGPPSDWVTYTAAGYPSETGAITEIIGTRTGRRLGLEWVAPVTDGGSPILVYTLNIVTENQQD